jgi:hypothetical protein
MERLRRAGALLGAAEREGGTILEPRFEPSYDQSARLQTLATSPASAPCSSRGPGGALVLNQP